MIIVILLFCLLIVLVTYNDNSSKDLMLTDNDAIYSLNEPYIYPVVPGMEEWEKLTNHAQKIDVCYVDPDLLRKMTTYALVETVVTYPLFVDAVVYDSFDMGLDMVSKQFAGIDELLNRQDAYANLVLYVSENQSEDNKDNIYVLNAIKLIKYFEEKGLNISKSLAYYSTSVLTPNNSSVQVYVGFTWSDWNTDYNTEDVYNTYLSSAYSNVTELYPHSLDPAYNCHSYAWYQQSSNNVWMADPGLYMSDGSYSASYPLSGRKITYTYTGSNTNTLEHSGVVSLVGSSPDSTYVTSKWGVHGLFYHRLTDCPYYHVEQQEVKTSISYWKLN